MLAVTFLLAAAARRWVPERLGGVAAGPALLVLLAAAAGIGTRWPRWAMFVGTPADPRWSASHGRWLGVLVAAVLCLVVASLDPASRFRRGAS